MEIQEKVLSFEYILMELLEWYDLRVGYRKQNDISILKALKLLFFVSAARTNKNQHSILLEEVFSSFVAMPYGHVESQVYDEIRMRKGKLNYFHINNQTTEQILGANLNELKSSVDFDLKNEIDLSIIFLKRNFPSLILLPAFELVNLSHAWYSWQQFYKLATKNEQRSHSIPPQVIKTEDKIFSIQTY